MAALPQDHVRALDQLRTRLSQLSTSIASLSQHLHEEDPLPSWPSLQADASTLGVNLAELASVLNAQRQMFTSMHAHPMSNFPGTTQEMMLHGLLRKKLDPRAEDWIEESLSLDKQTSSHDLLNDATNRDLLSAAQLEELWDWAPDATRNFLKPLLEDGSMEDDYTLSEQAQGVENVVTGIKRLDEDTREDDDKEDAEMQDAKPADDDVKVSVVNGLDLTQPPIALESLLKFGSGGDLAATSIPKR